MDILALSVTLILIMVFIVWATIGINTLMKGKVISLLLNRKLLLIIASIISALFTFAFMMIDEYNRGWGEFFWFVYLIGLIFVIVNYIPGIVIHLKKIHQSNLEDSKEQELCEEE
jgi:hypothetical protein